MTSSFTNRILLKTAQNREGKPQVVKRVQDWSTYSNLITWVKGKRMGLAPLNRVRIIIEYLDQGTATTIIMNNMYRPYY